MFRYLDPGLNLTVKVSMYLDALRWAAILRHASHHRITLHECALKHQINRTRRCMRMF